MFCILKEAEYLMEPIEVKVTSEEASRISKTAKKLILKGHASLDALFSKLCEKFKGFWTLQESGYLM